MSIDGVAVFKKKIFSSSEIFSSGKTFQMENFFHVEKSFQVENLLLVEKNFRIFPDSASGFNSTMTSDFGFWNRKLTFDDLYIQL